MWGWEVQGRLGGRGGGLLGVSLMPLLWWPLTERHGSVIPGGGPVVGLLGR